MTRQPSSEALSKLTEIEDFLSNVENTFVSLFPSCQALRDLSDHEYIEVAQLLLVQHKNTLLEVDRWGSNTFLGYLREQLAVMLDACPITVTVDIVQTQQSIVFSQIGHTAS